MIARITAELLRAVFLLACGMWLAAFIVVVVKIGRAYLPN